MADVTGNLTVDNLVLIFGFLLPSERREFVTAEHYLAFRISHVLTDRFIYIPRYHMPSNIGEALPEPESEPASSLEQRGIGIAEHIVGDSN